MKSNAAFALVKTSLDKVYDIQVLKLNERRSQRISWIMAIGWMATIAGVALYFAGR